MGRELTPNRIAPFTPRACAHVVLCGISTCFQVLSPCLGQIVHALLTRPPLEYLQHSSLLRSRPLRAFAPSDPVSPQRSVPEISPLDLHVLSTPPAFVLSQDQTLAFNPSHRVARLAKAGLPHAAYSSESDCSFLVLSLSLYRFQGSLAAAFSGFFAAPFVRQQMVLYQRLPLLSTPFFTFSAISFSPPHSTKYGMGRRIFPIYGSWGRFLPGSSPIRPNS